jgi:hypothetical protein
MTLKLENLKARILRLYVSQVACFSKTNIIQVLTYRNVYPQEWLASYMFIDAVA